MTSLNKIKLVAIVLSLSLVGCASTGESRARANAKIDWTKMQYIDKAALDGNVKVIWVNPPQKKPQNNRKP